jgi:predicted AAA+ superfamily ATPase
MKYIARTIENKLLEYLNFFSVVGITGPRQSGKSTLLRHCLPSYEYVSFDDFNTRELFYADPTKFLAAYPSQIIFDEAQKVPELFEYIKIVVDKDRAVKGRYVLTGSSQFTLLKNISESLAGRIGLLSLLPLDYKELPEQARGFAIYRGCYPELVINDYMLWQDWYSSYIDTYLLKDVRSIANVGDIRDFQRLLQLLAALCAQNLNFTNLSRELGVDIKTVKRWVSILEASYLIFILPPFYKNYGKRITKSPKVYFYDTGIVCFLNKIYTKEQYEHNPLTGAIFENFVIAEIYKKSLHAKSNTELYYLRANNNNEIDLIVDKAQNRQFIEIKSLQTLKVKMLQQLSLFKTEESKSSSNTEAILLYQGDSRPDYDNIKIRNFADYLLEKN